MFKLGDVPPQQIQAIEDNKKLKETVKAVKLAKQVQEKNFIVEQTDKLNDLYPEVEQNELTPEERAALITKVATRNKSKNARMLLLKQEHKEKQRWGIA